MMASDVVFESKTLPSSSSSSSSPTLIPEIEVAAVTTTATATTEQNQEQQQQQQQQQHQRLQQHHYYVSNNSTNLCREDFDGGPVSLDEIEKGLYLGNLTAATHMETLKNYKITHILTLDSVPLPVHITEASFLTTKYVHISDMSKEDILHHFDDCIRFIDAALEKEGNILVHCYFGVSRSSTIVIAYIMKKYSLEYSHAFEKVKSKRKFVQPNDGFIFQLKLYRRMGYKIDPQYPKYKTYRLRLAADKVRKAKILPQSCMDLIKPDPGVIQAKPEPIVYRCRKCRRIVATKSNLMTHIQKNLPINNTENDNLIEDTNKISVNDKKLPSSSSTSVSAAAAAVVIDETNPLNQQFRKCSLSEKSTGSDQNDESSSLDKSCKKIIFIEPLAWMKDVINQTQGRLNCPKCNQKLGSFSWINGCHCPCGTEIAPAFYLVPSKVELSKVVQNVQMTV